jgi:archaellum biogenesis ATPase FlaH
MLSAAAEQPIYIIVDALDECPNFSGIPTPREDVLKFLEDLVDLGQSNLHICVTSRQEVDIKYVLEPLASTLSLHNEVGQMKDISDYVSNFVSTDRMMGRWRSAEKELVMKELSKKADGM